MEICTITPGDIVAPFLRVTGQSGSEITGPAFTPAGNRLYFSSRRGTSGGGITYEITGPFPNLPGGDSGAIVCFQPAPPGDQLRPPRTRPTAWRGWVKHPSSYRSRTVQAALTMDSIAQRARSDGIDVGAS
jgi:hypothetical protein